MLPEYIEIIVYRIVQERFVAHQAVAQNSHGLLDVVDAVLVAHHLELVHERLFLLSLHFLNLDQMLGDVLFGEIDVGRVS